MLATLARVGLLALPSLAAVLLALYGAELYFSVVADRAHAGRNRGEGWDTRDRLEVVQDLREQGVDAYPAIFPRALMEPDSEGRLRSLIRLGGEEVLPLGGISRRTTVTCNESGEFAIYEADEHGFNNPLGLWDVLMLQVLAVGDSFTYGNCVPAERTLLAAVRRRFPATLNLGLGGVGPLLELAILREYAPALRPRVVLWVFYEGNDMLELREESGSGFLMGQLAGDPPQDLRPRQAELDAALTAFSDAQMEEFSPSATPLSRFLRLALVRQRLRQTLQPAGELADPGQALDFDLLRQVLDAAAATLGAWEGELVLVYLPGRDRYFGSDGAGQAGDRIHAGVAEIAQALGIEVVDLVPVFADHDDPAGLFVDAHSHLTADGYGVVADRVIGALLARGPGATSAPSSAPRHAAAVGAAARAVW